MVTENNLSMLRAEIARSTVSPQVAEVSKMDRKLMEQWNLIRQKLPKFRIRSDTEVTEQKHLLEINGVRTFPRGDLVAISGKEKCGKTTDCRILVSALLRGEYMGIKALEQNIRILWIDTEQARISTRTVTRGIELMCGFTPSDEQFLLYSMREYPDHDEMQMTLEVQFNDYRPDIVIVDGIRDYIDDFNDVVSSSRIVLKCMQLSSGVTAEQAAESGLAKRPPCCVVTILHQNKTKDDNTMRGHLGTELSNKAGEVWEAMRDDDRVFTFAQRCSRTRPVEGSLQYKVHSEPFNDQQGEVEEIGVPDLWTTEIKAEPEIKTIRTRYGVYDLTEDTALLLFGNFMQNNDFEFEALKRDFCDFHQINFNQFVLLRKLVGKKLYKGSDSRWYFDWTRNQETTPQAPGQPEL